MTLFQMQPERANPDIPFPLPACAHLVQYGCVKPEGGHRTSQWTSQFRSIPDKQTLQEEMREEWDNGARVDWRRSVWAEASGSEKAFRASGERDYKRSVGRLLSAFQIDPAGKVALEIGCGAGRVSEFIARDFRGLIAVDISRELLKIGRKRVAADNVLWLCNDGVSLGPVADHSVDFIFSLAVFQHIPDAATIIDYFEEASRVLKPGGWIVFQVMNQPHLSIGPWTVSLFVSRRFHAPRVRVYKPSVRDARPARMGFVRTSCTRAGLAVVRVIDRFNQNTWVWAQKRD